MEVRKEDLSQNYSSKTDEELLELYASRKLTELAYECLYAELTRRNIEVVEKHIPSENDQGEDQGKGQFVKAMGYLGAFVGIVVYFVYFVEEPEGVFSNFGKPTIFMVGGYILFALLAAFRSILIIVCILMLLRISLSGPFGPEGIICKNPTPYATSTAEYKFWDSLGGCAKVVER